MKKKEGSSILPSFLPFSQTLSLVSSPKFPVAAKQKLPVAVFVYHHHNTRHPSPPPLQVQPLQFLLSAAAHLLSATAASPPLSTIIGYSIVVQCMLICECKNGGTLEWKILWEMCGITQFAYLHHFFSKTCDECDSNDLQLSKANGAEYY
ncbi:hypothetical protein R6Q59_008027 [Mikania micrantha]